MVSTIQQQATRIQQQAARIQQLEATAAASNEREAARQEQEISAWGWWIPLFCMQATNWRQFVEHNPDSRPPHDLESLNSISKL